MMNIYENKLIKTLTNSKTDSILIEGSSGSGKTNMVYKLYQKLNEEKPIGYIGLNTKDLINNKEVLGLFKNKAIFSINDNSVRINPLSSRYHNNLSLKCFWYSFIDKLFSEHSLFFFDEFINIKLKDFQCYTFLVVEELYRTTPDKLSIPVVFQRLKEKKKSRSLISIEEHYYYTNLIDKIYSSFDIRLIWLLSPSEEEEFNIKNLDEILIVDNYNENFLYNSIASLVLELGLFFLVKDTIKNKIFIIDEVDNYQFDKKELFVTVVHNRNRKNNVNMIFTNQYGLFPEEKDVFNYIVNFRDKQFNTIINHKLHSKTLKEISKFQLKKNYYNLIIDYLGLKN